MTKNTNSKQRYDIEYTHYFVSVIEILNFEFVCNLVLVYCFLHQTQKYNHKHSNNPLFHHSSVPSFQSLLQSPINTSSTIL